MKHNEEREACLLQFAKVVERDIRLKCCSTRERANVYFSWLEGWHDHARGVSAADQADRNWLDGWRSREQWQAESLLEPEAAEYIPTNPSLYLVKRVYDPNPE